MIDTNLFNLSGLIYIDTEENKTEESVESVTEESAPTPETKEPLFKGGLAKIFDQELIEKLRDKKVFDEKFGAIEKLQNIKEVRDFLESNFTLEKIEELMTFLSEFEVDCTRRGSHSSRAYYGSSPAARQMRISELSDLKSANEGFFSADEIEFI